jgi:hypothetical protein
MSINFANVLTAPQAALSHRPEWVARLMALPWLQVNAGRVSRFGHSVWRALEESGRARANSELSRLADRYACQPEFSAALRAAIRRDGCH